MAEPKTFRVHVLINTDQDVLFECDYQVEENTLADPVRVYDYMLHRCTHGTEALLKEFAFHAGLIEAGK